MAEKIALIIIDTEKDRKGYIPCIVKQGETGYFITNWNFGADRAIAQKLADDYNARLGISRQEAMQLTLKSMRVQHDEFEDHHVEYQES